ELIKQIPLIKEVVDDQMMWMYSLDGNYTVKSGYQALGKKGPLTGILSAKYGTRFGA
ncbi:hypothetical protein A2U01_0062005, partial [Trifolium medium]|nr:hypothetical protein [Trifolium medium]